MAESKKKNPELNKLKAELSSLRRRVALFDASEAFARVGYFEWNLEAKCFESCSSAFATILGVDEDKLLDAEIGLASFIDRVYPEDRQAFRECFENATRDGGLDLEFRLIDRDGQVRTLIQAGAELPGNMRRSGILPVVVQDISAQISAEGVSNREESLALQAERISELGNFIYDEQEDRYLYASPGCARIYGISEEEYLQEVESYEEDLSDILDEDRDRVKATYDEYWHSGKDCEVEFRIHRADGQVRWIRELLVALQMKNGMVTLTQGVMQDITAHKVVEMELREAKHNLEELVAARTEELAETIARLKDEISERERISAELEFLANHDPLTGLPSLRLCKDRLERALAEARRSQHLVAVMFLDLDGFKAVNDRYGHEFGDAVLKKTASRIKATVREIDTVARFGGDEFLVILTNLPDTSVSERVAANLIQQVSQAIRVEHTDVFIGTSIGIAIYPDDASDSEELIRIADKAMYQVKNAGKNSFAFLHPQRLN